VPLSPHPRRTITAGWTILPICVMDMILGAFMSGATYAPGAASLLDAISGASRTHPITAFSSDGGKVAVFLTPVMVAGWLTYARARDRPRPHRKRIILWSEIAIVAVGLFLPPLVVVVVSPLLVVLAPINLLTEQSDPEFYTLGLFSWSGVGLWLWFLLVASELERRRPRQPAHLCQHCAYDRTGLDAAAPCPECGGYPTLELRRSPWR
jgi:hypothetical protein